MFINYFFLVLVLLPFFEEEELLDLDECLGFGVVDSIVRTCGDELTGLTEEGLAATPTT